MQNFFAVMQHLCRQPVGHFSGLPGLVGGPLGHLGIAGTVFLLDFNFDSQQQQSKHVLLNYTCLHTKRM